MLCGMKPLNLHKILGLNEIDIYEGIKLRPLNQSDATRTLEILAADTNIRDKVSVASRLNKPEDVAAEIERYRKDSGLIRYTLLKDNNPIGLVSLWRDDGYFSTLPNPDDYGFGYFLDPHERGKGLVVIAVQSLMKAVIKNLNVRQFIAFCEDNNLESIAVLTKLGFEPTDKTFTEPSNGWIERKYIKLSPNPEMI
jgi:RimJ/RimL family protein N-acetyltransferase